MLLSDVPRSFRDRPGNVAAEDVDEPGYAFAGELDPAKTSAMSSIENDMRGLGF